MTTLSLALALVAQDCRFTCNPPTTKTNTSERDTIRNLEPVPTAKPGPPPDESWRPDLGPGEILVPGSVRHYRVFKVGDQIGRSEVQTTPTPSTPAPVPQAVVPQAVVPQTYAAPMAAPSTSCYSSAYTGGYSYGAQTYSAAPQAFSSPTPAYFSPPPAYYSSPAPLYAAPPAPRRRGLRFAGGLGWGIERESYARTRLGLNLGIGQRAAERAACGPWGCR